MDGLWVNRELCRLAEGGPKPVVAALRGLCLGGGCEVAISCTARVGEPSLKMGLPELQLGIIPGFGGTQRLPRLTGCRVAVPMMLTSRPAKAKEALASGLIDHLVRQGSGLEGECEKEDGRRMEERERLQVTKKIIRTLRVIAPSRVLGVSALCHAPFSGALSRSRNHDHSPSSCFFVCLFVCLFLFTIYYCVSYRIEEAARYALEVASRRKPWLRTLERTDRLEPYHEALSILDAARAKVRYVGTLTLHKTPRST